MQCKDCESDTDTLCNDLCPPCFNAAQEAWQKKMSIRQNAMRFDAQRLINLLLTQHWMHECEIVPNYMPPFPREDTRPTCQVRWRDPSGTYPSSFEPKDGLYDDDLRGDPRDRRDNEAGYTYLRYSGGPLQGYFWDSYGEDMHSPELALIAISQAPPPRQVGCVIPTHGR